MPGQVRAQRGAVPAGRADHDDHEDRGAGDLGEHRAEGRAGDAEPGGVDEQQVEHDVEGVADHRDHQRGAGVLETAQDAGRGEHHQQRHGAEEGDPQVGRGRVGDLGRRRRRAAPAARRAAPRRSSTTTPIPTASQSPSTPWARAPRRSPAPRSAGDARGGAVGQEDAQPDRRSGGPRPAMPRPASGCGAEVADDGGVGEQEQRLGDQGEEGRDREPEDLAVRLRGSLDQPSHRKGHRTTPASYVTSHPGLWMNSGKPASRRYVDKPCG